MIKEKFNTGWSFRCSDWAPERCEIVTLPHDASIGLPRDPSEQAGGLNGFFRKKNYLYEKHFLLDHDSAEKNVYFEFEGVYHNAFVYVNGAYAGKCPNGYSNFYVDATRYLRSGENVLRVVVKDAVPSSRWYSGGGIYRDVNRMTADRLHICPDGVALCLKSCEPSLAVLEAQVEVEHTGASVRRARLELRLFDAEDNPVAFRSIPITVTEHARESYRLRLSVPEPRLWGVAHPYLYHYTARIAEDGQLIDEESGRYGIRSICLDPFHGLRINGESVKLRGGCIHQDGGIVGIASFPHVERQRISRLKQMGYNAIRSAHHPMGRNLLNVCDELGMLVMDEFSDVWVSAKVDFDYSVSIEDCWEHDIRRMVRKDRNHPCVILYSIGNEINDVGDPFNLLWGKRFSDLFRRLDPERLITNSLGVLPAMKNHPLCRALIPDAPLSLDDPDQIAVLDAFLTDNPAELLIHPAVSEALEDVAAQLDVVGYNYAAPRYVEDMRLYPERIVMGSETYLKDLDKNWALVEKYPRVIGDFSWTAWDYLGEAGLAQLEYDSNPDYCIFSGYPTRGAYVGDFDLIGDPRPTAYWRASIWGFAKKPWLAVQPPAHYGERKLVTHWVMTDALRSWNFSGYEGKPVVVEAYTDAQEAALYCNGREIARQPVGAEKKNTVFFDTIYEPGVLEVVVFRDGVELGRDRLVTAGAAKLSASADCENVPADGSDIAFVELEMLDEVGNRNPEAAAHVTVSIEGPGILVGLGSADPRSEENFFASSATMYQGRLRAAVRGSGACGHITLRAATENGECVIVRLQAV